jgi:hypothetical protein
MQADRLLGPAVSDVDGNKEDRKGTVSTFNGPPPDIMALATPEEEIKDVSQWLVKRVSNPRQNSWTICGSEPVV